MSVHFANVYSTLTIARKPTAVTESTECYFTVLSSQCALHQLYIKMDVVTGSKLAYGYSVIDS